MRCYLALVIGMIAHDADAVTKFDNTPIKYLLGVPVLLDDIVTNVILK